MASPLLMLSLLVPSISHVTRTANPRKVVVSIYLRATLIKLHEKSKKLLKQGAIHSSVVFSFHFFLLPIGKSSSPRYKVKWISLFAQLTLYSLFAQLTRYSLFAQLTRYSPSAFLSTSLCNRLLIMWENIKSFIKFTQELESLAPNSSKYQRMLTLATALKTINKQKVFLKMLWKRGSLYFLLCQAPSDTLAPLGAVCLQNEAPHLTTVSIWLSFNIC